MKKYLYLFAAILVAISLTFISCPDDKPKGGGLTGTVSIDKNPANVGDTVKAEYSGDGTIVAWQWYKGGSPIAGEDEDEYKIETAGNYKVRAIADDGKWAEKSFTVSAPAGGAFDKVLTLPCVTQGGTGAGHLFPTSGFVWIAIGFDEDGEEGVPGLTNAIEDAPQGSVLRIKVSESSYGFTNAIRFGWDPGEAGKEGQPTLGYLDIANAIEQDLDEATNKLYAVWEIPMATIKEHIASSDWEGAFQYNSMNGALVLEITIWYPKT